MEKGNMQPVPFNKPFFSGKEFEYIQHAIANLQLSGDGPFTKKCHALIESVLGVPKALLTTSCTHALEMAALLLNIKPGDEVIVPSFTFVSTVNAFVLRGARPVFVDVRPDTLNLDETKIESRITKRTRAIVPVHYSGVSCEMDKIMALSKDAGLVVVEDNAHGFLASYKGRNLGTIGTLGTQSFHETKNVSCGEGGALIINDPVLCDRAEILREKGTNRSRFYRGQVDKYTWVDVGSSYLPSEILAAYLFAQLEAREKIQAMRKRVWEHYFEDLSAWGPEHGVRLPIVPPECQQAYHMFYLLLPSLKYRQALIAHLRAQQINSVFHYQPLHLSEMGNKFGGRKGDCPVTEDISDRLVRLPFYNDLSEADQARVVEAIKSFKGA
jgi:dTDP-4-amino-4,6-dideoxygalactose transaminase